MSLLVLLGLSAGGGAVASRIVGNDQPRGQLAAETTLNDSTSDSEVTVNTLLQPCDLGACSGAAGWVQAQPSSADYTASPCPTYPQISTGHAEIFLVDNITGVTVFEAIWHVTDPGQAQLNFTGTAQGCSFTDSQNAALTYQEDDNAGHYGDNSAVFRITGTTGRKPAIDAYQAIVTQGKMVATVYVTPGPGGVISSSGLSAIFTAAAGRL